MLAGRMHLVDTLGSRQRFRNIHAIVSAQGSVILNLAELWCVIGCMGRNAVACVWPMYPCSTSCIKCTPKGHAAGILPRECRPHALVAARSTRMACHIQAKCIFWPIVAGAGKHQAAGVKMRACHALIHAFLGAINNRNNNTTCNNK